MKFLAPSEWQAWCVGSGVPLRQAGWLRPDLTVDPYHVVDIPIDLDAGRKVYLAGELCSLVKPSPQTLLLLDDWAVWSEMHRMPLFTRFRAALGEERPLIEAPGHLVSEVDRDDALSIVTAALLFSWDCYGIADGGGHGFYFSHDDYCQFASRDPDLAAEVERRFAGDGRRRGTVFPQA
ncbi:hypothetical protein Pla123a_18020 [Posidoniimonas polymericola]|uniref:Uncharacterized protein n=1 Tax=Posidoniimonas polymericola TaxID=2528002 RepID=A0A5C5YTE5_9BACT|nr:hypothetical protein [Posidoniimonas polymericola]TWT78003.1 hypothetical protein Pla123a_18020 [Posidoniimonas polymericola]